jgi:UDPglucose--hexose-1-phosphate uridylyltransferase
MTGNRDKHTTSELRHDWLADRWVIIAPQRTERPEDFSHVVSVERDSSHCPFCAGHELETPAPVASYSGQDPSQGAGWQVRVVPNKFPAVNGVGYRIDSTHAVTEAWPRITTHEHSETNLSSEASAAASNIDLFSKRSLSGGHEVIIESPQHKQSISQLDRESVALVFQAYRDRLAYWRTQRNAPYAVVFKNVGYDAGASLAHTHSQLIATDILPTEISRHVERMSQFRNSQGVCLFCRMLSEECEQGVRIVEQTPSFTAFCPFASRLPSMIFILPKVHSSSFETLEAAAVSELAWLTHRLIRRVERCYPKAAYNFVIHTAPAQHQASSAFHWRIELFPRLTKVAGFEWGSDCYINPLAPETAASALRTAGV